MNASTYEFQTAQSTYRREHPVPTQRSSSRFRVKPYRRNDKQA